MISVAAVTLYLPMISLITNIILPLSDSIFLLSRMVYAVKDLADFNAQLEAAGDKLVVVDFFATW